MADNYRFAAYKLADGKIYELEREERIVRGTDVQGHHVLFAPDHSVLRIGDDNTAIMTCTSEYGATVVYTATVPGTAYAMADVKIGKNCDGEIDVLLMTGDGIVLDGRKRLTSGEGVSLDGEAVLRRGDTVFLLVKYSDGSETDGISECVFESFKVDFNKHTVADGIKIPTVSSDTIDCWTTHSYDKLILNKSLDTNTNKYTVNIAKAETEGCQLVIKNDSATETVNGFLVLLSKPYGSVGIETFVLDHTENIDGDLYTDACRPYNGTSVSIAPKMPLPFLVEFTTSSATPAGDYRYLFAFADEKGNALALFEVTLHVYSFSLPAEKTFRTSMNTDMWLASVQEGVDENTAEYEKLKIDYYCFLLKHNITTKFLPVSLYSDKADDFMSSPLVTYIELPVLKQWVDLLPNEEIVQAYERISQNPEWLKKAGMYPFDEPYTLEQIQTYNMRCRIVRALCPEVQIVSPFYTNIQVGENMDQLDAMYQDVGAWCPKLCLWDDSQSYDYLTYTPDRSFAERMAEKRENGDELWTYVCNAPSEPYAQLFVNTDGVDQRLMFWQMYQRDINGFLYWTMNKWTNYHQYSDYKNPWVDGLNIGLTDDKQREIYGDGILMYPGKPVGVSGPVASLRMKQIRDGIDDIELMYLAEKYLGEEWVKSKVYEATPTLTSFTDNDNFYGIRKEICEALEKALAE